MKSRFNPSSEQVQITNKGEEALNVVFSIENKSMNLVNMIHFGIIELLVKINTDICDSYKMDVESEQRARLTLVLKHILKDLGVPQMCADVIITREDRDNMVTLTIKHFSSFDQGKESKGAKEVDMEEDYEVIPVKSVIIKFDIKNIHKIDICIDIFYNDEPTASISSLSESVKPLQSQNMRNFVDKMLKTLVRNIINRLKQFIEKMPYSNNTASHNNNNAI
jgi:hypothetical protein